MADRAACERRVITPGSSTVRRLLGTIGEIGRIAAIGALIVGVAVGVLVLRRASPAEQPSPAASGPAAQVPASSPAASGEQASPALPTGSIASTAPPSPSPSPEMTSPPTASPTPEPTPEPTARRTPKPTPRPTPRRTPYNGPPTAPPGTTPVPSPEGDVVVRGHLGDTLDGGALRVRAEWVDEPVPDGFCRAENGWVLAKYRITIWWTGRGPRLVDMGMLNAEGGGNCFGADIGAFQNGVETDFVVQQVPGKKAISIYFEYPDPFTTLAFKFR
jgi:hypothetical protein